MEILALTPNYSIESFDCGDPDLNDFLLNDTKLFFEKRIANTYVFEDNGQLTLVF